MKLGPISLQPLLHSKFQNFKFPPSAQKIPEKTYLYALSVNGTGLTITQLPT
jgi:hypothetical protein